MGTMIRPLAASVGQPVEDGSAAHERGRGRADLLARLERDREAELSARPVCVDCGTLRSFFTRRRARRGEIVSRPANLCDYCFHREEPVTEQDRLDRTLAVMRAWREDMRRHRKVAPIA
jgi:hypothetical protein